MDILGESQNIIKNFLLKFDILYNYKINYFYIGILVIRMILYRKSNSDTNNREIREIFIKIWMISSGLYNIKI